MDHKERFIPPTITTTTTNVCENRRDAAQTEQFGQRKEPRDGREYKDISDQTINERQLSLPIYKQVWLLKNKQEELPKGGKSEGVEQNEARQREWREAATSN